jgi:hypothetical protein
MNKPQITNLPDRQGIETDPGKVMLAFHQSGRHVFPLGTGKKNAVPVGFICPGCGADVLRVTTKGGSSVFSCHCILALMHADNDGFPLTVALWIHWIGEAWREAQKLRRIQAG